MTDSDTTQIKNSLLVLLPPELQGLVFDNLNQYDLNRLCLTCNTIKAVVLPKLYGTVVIRVPQRWSRLPSLEALLGSNGDGLKYTTELFIRTQQNPLRDSQRESEDSRSPEEVRTETELQFYLPQSSISNALNTLVRLLILKLPQDQLQIFCWEHSCELDISTSNLLFKRQKASLDAFRCNRYSSSSDYSGLAIAGLSDLSIRSMDPERGGCRWAASMMTANAEILDRLNLGFTTRIAHDFALRRRPRYDEMSTSFAAEVKGRLSELNLDPLIFLSLETLRLCGLDVGGVIRGEMALDIDFNNIIELRLESCPGLSQALFLLTGQGDASQLTLRALEYLFIRIEEPDQNFSGSLERFLTSIRALTHLKILVDQTMVFQDLEPILKVHGKTLKTLVWDERGGPRTQLSTSTSLLPTRLSRLGNWKIISQNCASLTTLGIPLDWEAINGSDKCHEAVRRCLRKMPYLEVLNVRNLPELTGRTVMPMDYFVKGLATMFVDIVSKNQKSTLTTIALGAPLYRDISIGTHHVFHTPVSALLRFRVYSIDYDYRSPSGVSPVLSEIVKGAAGSSEETSYPPLLDAYWLG